MESQSKNKSLIEKYMLEVWNKKNLAMIANVFSESTRIHSPLGQFKSREEMTETIQKWILAIPDLNVTLLHTLEDNDIVVSHWRATGTHQKALNGIEAQGKPITYQGMSMYRLENEKVIEYWAYLDSWTLEKQMRAS
ncbi:MAG: hypothetical protein S4CHLAM2_06280 [Chlamydiales bacterium]|nr:hypothetical protein [Chlamydiales bacterium]